MPNMDAQLQLNVRVSERLGLIAGANLRTISVICDQFQVRDMGENRAAGFVQAQWKPADDLQLTGGVRLDLSSETEAALSPRTVAVYRPLFNHSFRLGYGLAFRKPSVYETQVHILTDNYNPATPEILDKLRTALGTEDLTNEKVHSIEAGWQTQLLEDQLRLTVDLFYNIYQDTISFVVKMEQRMGVPDISNSTLNYENQPGQIHAFGGEAEAVWKFAAHGQLWGNLGLRRVSWADSGEILESEPTLRVNLGGRWSPPDGLSIDLALHYVSSYSPDFPDPANLFDERLQQTLGDRILLFGRLGYRLAFADNRSLETGFSIRTPLGSAFREWPGVRMPITPSMGSNADWGGDVLVRYASLYLRVSF
jgi:outer membrane receptor protein involved in Fe transport